MKIKDLKTERGDRTDKWVKCAEEGDSPIPFILNKTDAMAEMELREKVKVLLDAYKRADYVKSKYDSNFKGPRI